jgi:hypothetical protein
LSLSRSNRLACGAVLLALASPAFAQDRDVEEILNAGDKTSAVLFSTGIDYSRGDYGDVEATGIVVVPASLRVRATDWLSLGASLAWIRIDGPGVVLGPDNEPLPGFPIARQTRQGLGDLGASATVSLPLGGETPWSVDLTGRIKLPTASKRRGLTTGKTDFSFGADVSYLAGKWAPYIELGLRVPGDPTGIDLRNSPSVSIGTARILDRGAVIVSYDWQRAFSSLAEDSHSLFAAWSRPVAKRFDLTGYGSVGLSEGAAGIEAGVLVTVKLD